MTDFTDLLADEMVEPLFSTAFYEDPRTGEKRDLPIGLLDLLRTRELYTNMDWAGYGAFEDGRFDGQPTTDLGVADVAASQNRLGSDLHAIMVDIDHPARIVETGDHRMLEVVIPPPDGFQSKRYVRYPLPDARYGAWVIPTTTEGHNHLYVAVDWPFKEIMFLLDDWVHWGIVEPGYRDASRSRGKTSLRLPWVRKGGPRPTTEPVAF